MSSPTRELVLLQRNLNHLRIIFPLKKFVLLFSFCHPIAIPCFYYVRKIRIMKNLGARICENWPIIYAFAIAFFSRTWGRSLVAYVWPFQMCEFFQWHMRPFLQMLPFFGCICGCFTYASVFRTCVSRFAYAFSVHMRFFLNTHNMWI